MNLLFIIFLLGASTSCLAQSCSPSQDCSSSAILDRVADPESCTRFYVCVRIDGLLTSSDTPFDCEAGEYFDTVVGDCAALDGPTCYNTCNNYCDMVCDASTEGSRLAFPGEVDKYNLCLGGLPVETDCPPSDPFFNGADCVPDASSVCDFCFPYCAEVGLQVADPDDCTSFYVCAGVGAPDWDIRGTCESGMYFNPVSGDCTNGTVCTNICSEPVTTTTTAPTTTTGGPTTTGTPTTTGAPTTTPAARRGWWF